MQEDKQRLYRICCGLCCAQRLVNVRENFRLWLDPDVVVEALAKLD